jgi:hypothetical protein
MPKLIRFSSSLCTLFHKSISHHLPNTRFIKGLPQNSKHTPKPKENSLQKIHVPSHNYVSNSKSKITSKLHKVLQEKVSQKHKNITHILEVNFGMEPHSKGQVSSAKIITRKSPQKLRSFSTKFAQKLNKSIGSSCKIFFT